jgi:hypothetical protein
MSGGSGQEEVCGGRKEQNERSDSKTTVDGLGEQGDADEVQDTNDGVGDGEQVGLRKKEKSGSWKAMTEERRGRRTMTVENPRRFMESWTYSLKGYPGISNVGEEGRVLRGEKAKRRRTGLGRTNLRVTERS